MACWSDPKVEHEQENVHLNAVYGEDGINKQWSKWTPAGSLNLSISNPDAQGFFRAGKEYIVTIREAQPGE